MTSATKERPAGVTILALLSFIVGGSFAYGTRIFGSLVLHSLAGLLINPLAGIVVIVGLAIALVQAGLFIAIGIGLLKMQNWARVLGCVKPNCIALRRSRSDEFRDACVCV